MTHDYAAQRAETDQTFADLQAEHGLPDTADVDYFVVPVRTGAKWQPLAEVLSNQGFECTYFAGESVDEEPYLMATLGDHAVSALAIWTGEEIVTRHALEHGFAPDGWGLMG